MSRTYRLRMNKKQQILAVIAILIIGAMGMVYLAFGTPTWNAENIDSANVVALTAAGSNANVTGVTTDGNKLEFTLGVEAAVIKIPLKDQWKDVKGTFTGMYVSLKGLEYTTVYELAKVYATDGSTDVYLGSITEDDKEKMLDIDTDDLDILDDFAKATFVIKFYDSQGNLVDCLSANVEQNLEIYGTVKADTSTITGFLSSLALALIVAVRKFIVSLTSALTSFLLAITTNSAILVVLGALVVVIGWFIVSGKKFWK
ncbi:MAG: hypothetical protein B6U76_01010 [Desulfurococcales archaeon ex4484_217_2]|nr:MAG: hypothetical protein B6U76_01010 [Desulfurococcales archaeon ex4484_217_2]